MIPTLGQITTGICRLSVWFLVLALVFIPLERRFPKVRQPILRRKWLEDLGFYFLNGFIPTLLIVFPVSVLAFVHNCLSPNHLYTLISAIPFPARLFCAIIVGEIGAYWGHRLSHEVPFLWKIHSIHHSAEQLDWLVNSRAHPLDFVITRTFGLVPVYLLGFAQTSGSVMDAVSFFYVGIGTFWSYFVHANVRFRIGFLEHVLATPAFHHWHHANDDINHVNNNYAAIFPWVDRFFGTLFMPRRAWPSSYGIISGNASSS